MKKQSSGILILVFFVGLSVLLYPSVSNWWNTRHMTQAIASYDAAAHRYTPDDTSAAFAAAEAYNAALAADPTVLYRPDEVPGYDTTLDVSGTGIMGYVSIDKIKVSLPIYHGTDESVLAVGVGHLQGSALPVGGAGTHAVLSAHRGLPSATLFSNLDRLVVGDTFTITVLDRLLTYEVDRITIVLPTEAEGLLAVPGQDYCTLMTCTPYGINSHRLLVRGRRVANAEDRHIVVEPDATVIDPLIVAPAVALPILLVLLALLLIQYRPRGQKDRVAAYLAKHTPSAEKTEALKPDTHQDEERDQ